MHSFSFRPSTGVTALTAAAANGHYEVVEYLLSQGASVDKPNSNRKWLGPGFRLPDSAVSHPSGKLNERDVMLVDRVPTLLELTMMEMLIILAIKIMIVIMKTIIMKMKK